MKTPKVPKVKRPKIIDEFRDFITKGNVVDLAVAVVIGLAFTAVVNGMVGDIITPLISPAVHGQFSNWTETVNTPGGPIKFLIGPFINAVISFFLIALVVFFLIVKPMATMKARQDARKPKADPTTKECPYCISQVPIKATRCMYCTSTLELASAPKPPTGP